MCGGTGYSSPVSRARDGLSPRVRGNQRAAGAGGIAMRSIPACAGEPPTAAAVPPKCEVYPRVCGGTAFAGMTMAARKGLSPRVRGNLLDDLTGAGWQRSIPACAGEPAVVIATAAFSRVYPRVCGGTVGDAAALRRMGGLSPRVRGNRSWPVPAWLRAGSIPACAGEPICLLPAGGRGRVYPRVCGGTGSVGQASLAVQGLSPRVRGNRRQSGEKAGTGRSIPACAGEPWTACISTRTEKVYPRVCGGTRFQRPPGANIQGLSPRVRGNPRNR